MSTEHGTISYDQAIDVTKTQRCRRCQQLKPMKAFALKGKGLDARKDTCKFCQSRLYEAWKWRKEQGYPTLPGQSRERIDSVLKISNRRLCFYCFNDGHVDDFTLPDPYECKHCEGKWIKPKEKKPDCKRSKMDLFIEQQNKEMTSMREQLNALMNVVSVVARKAPEPPKQDPTCPACGSVNTKNKGSFDKCMDCGARIMDYHKPQYHQGIPK